MAKIFVFSLLIFGFFKSSSSVPKDLGNACQNIWNAAGNNLKVPLELKVDTSGGVNPVFTLEPAGQTKVSSSNVFTTFTALLTTTNVANKEAFLNTIVQPGGPVEQALNYLITQKKFPVGTNLATFRNTLEDMWFSPLPGKSFPGKGFPHVFTGEAPPGKTFYSGFHNWYQFYLEQSQSNINSVNVPGYKYNTEPSFINLGFKWNGRTKTTPSSLFVGTSPAFDFALYSTCFISLYMGGGGGVNECTCKIHKSTLTIKAIEKPAKSGKICTVYPLSIQADAVCTSIQPTARTDCGWLGIDHHNCAERGCCFDSQKYGGHIYWCFYPLDHKCHGINPKQRKDCGRLGISRDECEGKGCCFDENFGEGVPHCFQGVPKG